MEAASGLYEFMRRQNMDKLELYWSEIPVGKENAVSYDYLCTAWGISQRAVRSILHKLSIYDNGDDTVLIRSSKDGGGFYRSSDSAEIAAYRAECLRRGQNTFAPLKKIDRVLSSNNGQLSIYNNLRAVRVATGLKAKEVCKLMRATDPAFDESILSKMENDRCLPTAMQLRNLAEIYGVKPSELIGLNEYVLGAISC